ncbi:hypothetical protein ABZ815_37800 [Nonomuraea sp. NPDC047529]|uniref:hypothetical protein n=1 Tax=Nonomuraea sp. NPDC047529 TaxID=3155623 RepID=UPI0033CC15E7
MTQLGQVAGIAGLGAVFLALHVPSQSAATAATVTNVSVAALVLLSGVFAAFLPNSTWSPPPPSGPSPAAT